MKAIKISYFDKAKGQTVTYKVGENCVSIMQHSSYGEGGRWHYDIELVNDVVLRVFVSSSTTVLFEK